MTDALTDRLAELGLVLPEPATPVAPHPQCYPGTC
jgi:hypothetical protein